MKKITRVSSLVEGDKHSYGAKETEEYSIDDVLDMHHRMWVGGEDMEDLLKERRKTSKW